MIQCGKMHFTSVYQWRVGGLGGESTGKIFGAQTHLFGFFPLILHRSGGSFFGGVEKFHGENIWCSLITKFPPVNFQKSSLSDVLCSTERFWEKKNLRTFTWKFCEQCEVDFFVVDFVLVFLPNCRKDTWTGWGRNCLKLSLFLPWLWISFVDKVIFDKSTVGDLRALEW